MKYFSLFSGIGGFELGILQAYVDISRIKEREIQGKDVESMSNPSSKDGNRGEQCPLCVGYSEVDKYAIQIYEKHFNHKNYGDITKIKAEELPDFELLCGGFPCQAFSIAGKRKGFEDTRGTLFFDIARLLSVKQPRLLLLENVKGLLSHEKGRTFSTILATLDGLGYDLQWQVLNSKNFGVPQNRERVFIIGHLRGTSRPEVFPITQSSQGNLKYSGGVISAREQWLKDGKTNSRNFSQGQRIYSTEGISQTLAGNAGGQGGKTGLYQISNASKREFGFKDISPALLGRDYKEPKIVKQPFVAPVLTPDRLNKRQNGRRIKEDGEPSFTLTSQDKHGVMIGSTQKNAAIMKEISPALTEAMGKGGGHVPMQLKDAKIRRLTPTECERLQGFPDGWTEGVSDTQRYKTLGNAVTVNVIKEIARKVIHS